MLWYPADAEELVSDPVGRVGIPLAQEVGN